MGNAGSKGGGGNDRCSNSRTVSYVSEEGRTMICIRGQDGSYPSGHGNSRGGDGSNINSSGSNFYQPSPSHIPAYSTTSDSVKSIISQNAINREIHKETQIQNLVNEFKGKYPNASEKSLRDIADYVAYGDNHYNDLTYFAQGHLLGDSGEVFGLPIMGNTTSIKEYKEVKKSLENAGYYFEYVHNSSVQGGKGYWVKVGIAKDIFKSISKDSYYTPLKKVAQSFLLGDQSSGSLWGLPITGDPTTIQKYINAKIALESEGYQFEYIHYSTLVPGSKGYWVKVNPGTSTSTPKAYWRDQDIFNIVTMEKIALLKNSAIIEFSLSDYKLGDKYISHVSDILKSNICANLKVLDLKNNNLTDTSVMSISNNITTGKVPSLKVLNLADNNITDKGAGYLAESLASKGHTIKKLHLEGNNLKKGSFIHPMSKLSAGIDKGIKILVAKVTNIKDGVVKQGTFVFSSTEEKKAIIKDFLKTSQENGLDTKNVAVSKDLWGKFTNTFELTGNFIFGWVKCTVVPDSFGSFVGDQIIAKASPLVGQINLAMDITTCYFESFDENAHSKEAVQFLGDIGLITQGELLEGIE